jgi:Xaa-Pro aminopeptidase
MYFPRDEYEARWSRLHAEMARRGLDTVVLWQRTGGGFDRAGDVWYLSNYASLNIGQEPSATGVGQAFAALLVRRDEEPELHILAPGYSMIEGVDRRYVAVDAIHGHDDNLATGVGERLAALGIEGPVGYVGDDFLPIEMYRALVAASPAIEWLPHDDLLYGLQHVKSPRELDLYREAGEISSRALTAFMEGLIRGDRQCDAAAAAAAILVGAGGGFQRLGCHTGPRGDFTAWDYPLYGYSRAAAEPGDVVRAWVVPVIEGYWLDPGRTSVCGLDPTPAQRRLIEDAAGVTEDVLAALRPGATPREVGLVGDASVRRRGYPLEEQGGGVYGHGMSTFWAGPLIPSEGNAPEEPHPFWRLDEPFHDGQLYTAEAFLHVEGVGNAGFEEILIIHEDGVERVTTTPMLFW